MVANNNDAIHVEQDESGLAKIVMRQADGIDAVALVPYDRLGFLAAHLLAAASLAHRRSSQNLQSLTESDTAYPTIIPTTFSLGPSHLQDHDSITLRFGEATLGLAIPRTALLALGQALVALGAAGRAH